MRGKSQSELMSDVERLFTKLQPSIRSVFDGLGNGSVTPQIVKFYSAFDMATASSKVAISCKPGCTYCCHYHVMVTGTEVFAIAEAVEKLPVATRDLVKGRIRAVASQTKGMPRDTYVRTNIECAMLQQGRCSVYASRPIACRGHHSADVSVCKKTFDDVNSTALAPKDYDREVVFRAFDNLQLAANHSAGVDTTKYELHAALLAAVSNPVTWKRWRSGKSAFPDVTDKVTLAEMMAGE